MSSEREALLPIGFRKEDLLGKVAEWMEGLYKPTEAWRPPSVCSEC